MTTAPTGAGTAEPGPARRGPGIGRLRLPPRLPGRRRAGPIAGLLAGAAASTFTTSVAAGVAGYQASRSLEPIEFTLRVGILIAAPCMGAVLATLVLPRRIGPRLAWPVGIGIAVGPLLALRLDRMLGFGIAATLAAVAALGAWAAAGVAVAAAAVTRTDAPVDRADLPPPDPEPVATGGPVDER